MDPLDQYFHLRLGRVLEMVRERFDWQIQSEDMAGGKFKSSGFRRGCWGWVGFGFVGVLGGFFLGLV